jgi:outer membrane immunogenic protein
MRKLFLMTGAFGLLALPAMAADLAPIYKAPAPACIWCGFYVGLNAGGTWSDNNSVNVTSGATQDFFDRQLCCSLGGRGVWESPG